MAAAILGGDLLGVVLVDIDDRVVHPAHQVFVARVLGRGIGFDIPQESEVDLGNANFYGNIGAVALLLLFPEEAVAGLGDANAFFLAPMGLGLVIEERHAQKIRGAALPVGHLHQKVRGKFDNIIAAGLLRKGVDPMGGVGADEQGLAGGDLIGDIIHKDTEFPADDMKDLHRQVNMRAGALFFSVEFLDEALYMVFVDDLIFFFDAVIAHIKPQMTNN